MACADDVSLKISVFSTVDGKVVAYHGCKQVAEN